MKHSLMTFNLFRFKNRGGNFRVDVPRADVDFSNISVPEDLCGIQAYLRWERNGKQNYSPEQEQVLLSSSSVLAQL